MPNVTDAAGDRLVLRSRIYDLHQIPAWIERLTAQYGLSYDLQFAMNLCLEEVVSNIIRHGYSHEPGRIITIQLRIPAEGRFVFEVEDEAPRFNPLNALLPPSPKSLDDPGIGGQGIRLLREFAHTLEYREGPIGNCLRIGFSTAGPAKTEL